MKSAETRAKHIVVKLVDLLRLDNLVEENIEFLETFLTTEIKKHERDTRYKAIEVVQEQQRYSVDVGGGGGWPCVIETVGLDEACGNVHNLEVIDD